MKTHDIFVATMPIIGNDGASLRRCDTFEEVEAIERGLNLFEIIQEKLEGFEKRAYFPISRNGPRRFNQEILTSDFVLLDTQSDSEESERMHETAVDYKIPIIPFNELNIDRLDSAIKKFYRYQDKRSSLGNKQVYRKYDISKLCKVSEGTVRNWFNRKLIETVRISGSEDYIGALHDDLVKFFEKHGMIDYLRDVIYTSYKAAEICQVAPHTLEKWFDNGELGGFRLPFSQDMRVSRRCLVEFMDQHGMLEHLGDRLYTTGEVARICNVSPGTVKTWFDNGELEGYRIPGTEDRRIPRQGLERFTEGHVESLLKIPDKIDPDLKVLDDPDNYFTPKQVANICQVSTPTVDKWIENGHLNGYKTPIVNKSHIVSGALLVEFLKRNDMYRFLGQEMYLVKEAGKACHVSDRTINVWYKEGRLDGYELPGEKFKHLRISRQSVEKYQGNAGITEDIPYLKSA